MDHPLNCQDGTSCQNKLAQGESSGDLSIEELYPDDMAYDADTEAIQPDVYEDAESDTDTPIIRKRKFDSIDELSSKMKQLGHDQSESSTPQTPIDRGRRRRLFSSESRQKSVQSPAFEIVEIAESNSSPPRKKTRHDRASSLSGRACQLEKDASKAHSDQEKSTNLINDAMDIS